MHGSTLSASPTSMMQSEDSTVLRRYGCVLLRFLRKLMNLVLARSKRSTGVGGQKQVVDYSLNVRRCYYNLLPEAELFHFSPFLRTLTTFM